MKYRALNLLIVVPGLLALMPEPVAAYFGPGGVVSGIGALLALGAAVIASVFGFVWFPIKRLLRRVRGTGAASPVATSVAEGATE